MSQDNRSVESLETSNATGLPPYSRVARQFHMKAGNQFATSDGAHYQISSSGTIVRRNPKTKSKKQRNRAKREARKGSAA